MPAAPGALRRDLQAALDLLLIQPDIGCQVPKASSPGVRRFYRERVWHWIYYRIRSMQLRRNAYRVLLTRWRDATVIFVPPIPELDETFTNLIAAGLVELRDSSLQYRA